MRRVFAPFAKDKLSSASPRIGSAVAITEHMDVHAEETGSFRRAAGIRTGAAVSARGPDRR